MKTVQITFKRDFGDFIARLDSNNKIISQDSIHTVVEMPDNEFSKVLARQGGVFATGGGVSPVPPGPILPSYGMAITDIKAVNIDGGLNFLFLGKATYGVKTLGADYISTTSGPYKSGSFVTFLMTYQDALGSVEVVLSSAFSGHMALGSMIALPNCRRIENEAFRSVGMTILQSDAQEMFKETFGVDLVPIEFSLPKVEYIDTYAFLDCPVGILSLPKCSYIGDAAIDIDNTSKVYLGYSGGVVSYHSYPISGSDPAYPMDEFQLFVRPELLDAYKQDSYFGTLASYIYPYSGWEE